MVTNTPLEVLRIARLGVVGHHVLRRGRVVLGLVVRVGLAVVLLLIGISPRRVLLLGEELARLGMRWERGWRGWRGWRGIIGVRQEETRLTIGCPAG
jgi:hypothetical protein